MKQPISLRQYAIVFYLFLAFIALATIIVFVVTTRTSASKHAQYWHQTLVKSLAREVDQQISEQVAFLNRIAVLETKYNRMQALAAADRATQLDGSEFAAIYFTDRQGYIINVAFAEDSAGDPGDFILMRLPGFDGGQRDRITWNTSFLSAQSRYPVVQLLVPLPSGYLVGEINLSSIKKKIEQIPLPEGSTLFLVDAKGNAIFPDHRNHRATADNPLVRAAMAGDSWLSDYGDGSGLSGATASLTINGWHVCFEQLQANVFALNYKLLRQNLFAWSLALLFVLVVFKALHRQIVIPLRWIVRRSEEIPSTGIDPQAKMPPAADELTRLWETLRHSVQQLQQREQALHEARREAETSSRAKSVFLAKMGHELRTPLNGILGCTQELQRGETLHREQGRSIATITDCGTHLLDIINDILDYAKAEAGKIELVPVRLNLDEFVGRLCTALEYQATEKQLQFSWHLVENLPPLIEADPVRLRQVLYNLLGNALKFTEHGGIGLFVTTQTLGQSRILLHFAVEDTGPGIPAQRQSDIFTPFTQTGERLRYAEGSGLGLSISRELVQLMGGELQVTSPLTEPQLQVTGGAGCRFAFAIEVNICSDSADLTAEQPSPSRELPTETDTINFELPPPELTDPLLAAARRGDIVQLGIVLDQLESTDVDAGFILTLRRLADDYKIGEIIKIIARDN